MSRLISMISVAILCSCIMFAQNNEYKLDDVVVSASNSPVYFKDLARNVKVITKKELQEVPVDNLQDLLNYALGADLRTRGTEGVQADVGFRGGSFEQTLILIDGIKMTDPQTGHHNMNLPVSLDHIERIEILKGQGSNIYGPNAFSGAINFITKKGTEKNYTARLTGGAHSLVDAGLYISQPISSIGNHLSVSRKSSDGYRPNTDFTLTTITYSADISLSSKNRVNLLFGYNDKDFGANSFYTDRFPKQREHTNTKLISLSDFGNYGNWTVDTKVFLRTNKDEFWLNYENPAFYYNNHKSNTFGAEIKTSVSTDLGTTSFGGEFIQDKINSNNLGNHTRQKFGAFVEQNFDFNQLKVIAGGYAYNFAEVGWKFWPNIDISYLINENLKLYTTAGMAFRIPTFTELYYSDPATQGDANLKQEQTTNFELGVTYNVRNIRTKASIFTKLGKDLIDYIREDSKSKWTAKNIGEITTSGIELSVDLLLKKQTKVIETLGIDYSYLNSNKDTSGDQSRYAYNFLKHQAIFRVVHILPYDIHGSWAFRYEERLNQPSRFLTDVKISRKFGKFGASISASNLFNKKYNDIAGVPLAGTWVKFGINFGL